MQPYKTIHINVELLKFSKFKFLSLGAYRSCTNIGLANETAFYFEDYCKKPICWETYVGQQFYILTWVDLIAQVSQMDEIVTSLFFIFKPTMLCFIGFAYFFDWWSKNMVNWTLSQRQRKYRRLSKYVWSDWIQCNKTSLGYCVFTNYMLAVFVLCPPNYCGNGN